MSLIGTRLYIFHSPFPLLFMSLYSCLSFYIFISLFLFQFSVSLSPSLSLRFSSSTFRVPFLISRSYRWFLRGKKRSRGNELPALLGKCLYGINVCIILGAYKLTFLGRHVYSPFFSRPLSFPPAFFLFSCPIFLASPMYTVYLLIYAAWGRF